MSQVKIVIEQRSRRRWAAYGFLLIVALTIISWFTAPSVLSFLKGSIPAVARGLSTMPPLHQQIAFTLVIFVLLALLSALVVTFFVPKRPLDIKDKALVKERADNLKYQQAARKRQRQLNRQMREHVEKNQKQ